MRLRRSIASFRPVFLVVIGAGCAAATDPVDDTSSTTSGATSSTTSISSTGTEATSTTSAGTGGTGGTGGAGVGGSTATTTTTATGGGAGGEGGSGGAGGAGGDGGDGGQGGAPPPGSPVVTAVAPNNSLASLPTVGVTVTGDFFEANAQVTFAGVAAPIGSCDYAGIPTTIVCTIPGSPTVKRGDVVVTNPSALTGTLQNAWTYTGVVNAVGFCNVQFPKDLISGAGGPAPINVPVTVYGQVYAAGMTDASNQPVATIVSDFGLSQLAPVGVDIDPTTSTTWRFFPAAPNAGFNFAQNNDEHQYTLVPNVAGLYRYVFRFSLDSGVNYTYCDKDDSNNGFSGAQVSQIQVQ